MGTHWHTTPLGYGPLYAVAWSSAASLDPCMPNSSAMSVRGLSWTHSEDGANVTSVRVCVSLADGTTDPELRTRLWPLQIHSTQSFS